MVNKKYTIYKITNIINNKIYIGKHITENIYDDYMGSGKLLKRSIKKNGLRNFLKEILFVFDNEEEMNNKEKELVNENFISREDTYNICIGGSGGFSYINKNITPEKKQIYKASQIHHNKIQNDIEYYEKWKKNTTIANKNLDKIKKISSTLKKLYKTKGGSFKGLTHSDLTKTKMSESKKITSKGIRNSQYGKFWITNGIENKSIRGEIPIGWYKGRILK